MIQEAKLLYKTFLGLFDASSQETTQLYIFLCSTHNHTSSNILQQVMFIDPIEKVWNLH